MEKKFALELDVIHFNTEDLIVTSTTGPTSIHSIFSSKHTYYTEKSNLRNSGYDEPLGNYDYFHFTPSFDAEIPEFSNLQGDKHLDNVSSSYYYAWYDGKWYTDNLLKEHYNPSN